jgi:hypothetical protein
MRTKFFFDKKGKAVETEEFAKLHDDPVYAFVARSKIQGILISTVWIGIDLNFTGHGAPIIFETMVFGSGIDDSTKSSLTMHYSTVAEARRGHAIVVGQVKEELKAQKEDR